jgi:TctA family transporter
MFLLEQALSALTVVLDPGRFLVIMLGVVLGLFIGVVPGIGGLVGMALLLPFTYTMDPYTAMAFLIGMWAVTPTADTIPSIMLGVPGSAGSAATVMDGYPMARRGEGGRALGASYTASVLGGLFGALLLGATIPLLRPFMLSFGSPELFALCVLGLTLVAAVSQGQMMKGLVAASLGVILSSIGDHGQTGELRWTFGTFYLWEGLPLTAAVLGLFAVPELIDVAASRKTIAAEASHGRSIVRDQFLGVRDALRNWRLVLQSSWLGSVLGAVPGIGGATIDWIAYGSAARTVKDGTKTFGTGDVRGVIATEAANNSREGGALVPTIVFGIPGSASMAILLGAFVMHGIHPGPSLLGERLDVTYTIVWSLALGNVVGVAICFLFVAQLARLARIPPGILVPIVLAVVVVGAYQENRNLGDLWVLVGFSVLGWTMKRFGWARAPLLLGLVLGELVERYLFISVNRYGFEWLERPGVIAILALPALLLAWRGVQTLVPGARLRLRERAAERTAAREAERAAAAAAPSASRADSLAVPAIWAVFAAVFAAAALTSAQWAFAARLMPQTVAVAGLAAVLLTVVGTFIQTRRGEPAVRVRRGGEADALAGMSEGEAYRRVGVVALWVAGLVAGVLLVGMMPSLLLFMILYMRVEGRVRWRTTLLTSGLVWAGMAVLFARILNVPWPRSLLGDTVPALRAALWGLL